VQSVWSLVGSNKLPGVADDAVSQALAAKIIDLISDIRRV